MKYFVKVRKIITDEDLGIKIKLSNQRKLADFLGVSRTIVYKIVTGRQPISEERYLKIKDYLSTKDKEEK